MQFSLIGDQADAALLVQSIGRSSRHSLGALNVRGILEHRLLEQFPEGGRRVATAEEALVDAGADVVVIAENDPDESIRLARQASQADCHVVVVPPGELSTAYSYELHLLLDETPRGVVVLTGSWYLADESHIESSATDCQLGLPSGDEDGDPASTLLHAIDACSALGFANSQVTVLGADDDSDLSSSQQVVLSGASAAGTASPAVTLNRSRSSTPFQLEAYVDGAKVCRSVIIPGHVTDLDVDTGQKLCDRIERRLSDDSDCQFHMEQFSRSLQVVEAMARSIKRRRTIDVYGDELSERSVFKTQMTAMGCGVLTWLMFGMVGYLMVGQLLKPPVLVMQVLRGIWIAPVVFFLLAQFLLPLARGRQQSSSSSESVIDRETS